MFGESLSEADLRSGFVCDLLPYARAGGHHDSTLPAQVLCLLGRRWWLAGWAVRWTKMLEALGMVQQSSGQCKEK